MIRPFGYGTDPGKGYATWHIHDELPTDLSGMVPAYDSMADVMASMLMTYINHGIKGMPQAPSTTLIEGKWHAGKTAMPPP